MASLKRLGKNEFAVSSLLAVEPEALWRHAVSPNGVNRELGPLLHMTFPSGTRDLTASWQPGQRQFRSWLLALRLVPVEYDDVVFVEVEPGRRFLERSSMWTQRVWEHERTVEAQAGGSRITDRVRFEPRLPGLAPLQAPIFEAVFRRRHRNLRRLFAEVAG
ncbi:MAG: hypothetical protein QNK04_01480 [Myxococcota bacterium]|nr:hypothetical protein [Myxococcota bacterium]